MTLVILFLADTDTCEVLTLIRAMSRPVGMISPDTINVYEPNQKIFWLNAQNLRPWAPNQNCYPMADLAERPIFKKIHVAAENLL